ncbi:MAG: CbtB domain-containing protein [Nitrosopumilus sp.]
MSESRQLTVSKTGVPKLAILALAIIFAAGLFVVGFDNGHIVSLVFAEDGSTGGIDPLVIHEFTHDMRHAAGFPCH